MKYIKPEDYSEDLTELVNNGATLEELSKHFGITHRGVAYRLKKLGLKAKPAILPFTEEEKAKMLYLHNLPTDAVAIAKELNTTQFRVLKFLKDSGADTSLIHYTQAQVDSVIADYLAGYTFEMLEQKYNMYKQCLDNILKKNKVVKRNKREVKQNSWYVWEGAFKDMTDEKSLFFYGLLLADGCLTKQGAVTICLQARDRAVLEKLNEYLGRDKGDLSFTKRNLQHHQDKYTIRFMDSVVYNTLVDLGMTPRKSLKETVPNVDMTEDQARHFWRGCIAGDGSIMFHNNVPSVFLCGSEELCNEFANFIQRVVGLKDKPTVHCRLKNKNSQPVYNVTVSGSKAVKLADYLFKDSTVNLDRKYETYLKFSEYSPKYYHKKHYV